MIVKLKDVAKLQGGYAFKSADFVKGGIPIVRIGNIVENKICIDDKITINDYEFKKVHPEFVINKGDILVAMSGATVGKIGVYELEEESLLNQRVGKFVTTDKVKDKYLYYILRSKLFNKYILENAFGCAQPNISGKQIEEFEFKLYEKEQQKQIIEILDRVQESIDIRKKQIESLDSLIKARFVELFGDPETNPNGWKQVTVGDVCSSIVRGPFGSALKKEFFVEPSKSTYKVYEQKHAIQKSATIGTYYITEEKYQELKRFECLSGDILMSCSGTMGELYQLPQECERGIINQALCKFTLNDKMLPICFLTYMRQTIGNLETKGSGIKNIAAVSYVKAMPINLPPMSVQIEFENFCKQADKSKLELQKSLEEMQNLFDSLMAEYFG